jgi:hypothetical protein
MKIGVIDSDGVFEHPFFAGKKIEIKRLNPGITSINAKNFPLTHAEYVCAAILKENPNAEILLYNIVGPNTKKTGGMLLESLKELIFRKVDIINLSIGIEGHNFEAICKACDVASRVHIPIIAAHSNSGNTTYPANLRNVLGVRNYTKKSNLFFTYDSKTNDIVFSDNYVSFYQLNCPHLMSGNSFLAAQYTGLLSNFIENKITPDAIKITEQSPFNRIFNIKSIKSKNTFCISNRPNNILQLRFLKECFQCTRIVAIESLLNNINLLKTADKCSVCLIDIDSYPFVNKHRLQIQKIINVAFELFDTVIMRYPFFSFYDRFCLFKNNGNILYQLYF